ncbi:Dimethylaniline monooxygenase [N-oxide-forming] [Aphelenchoides besseyi]|nr:Dimethylaniline monooxygenase [N-oxide-forming] [Aphelenchoides besseyi]KAI6231897.1 Dimethylaniline monooxygenase [N-oxide-forming] [Aphelenchoides besseyi]
MTPTKRCAVIGAGASGIPSARWSLEYGYETVVFEATDEMGGLWNFKADETEFSTVAKSTVINTSKEMTAYSDYPPPATDGNYMHNLKLKKYLCNYADEFGVTQCIKFKHRVLNVERSANYQQTGRWDITYKDNDGNEHRDTFDAVLVCTGHHATPNMPKFKNQDHFKGRIIHSHSYKVTEEYSFYQLAKFRIMLAMKITRILGNSALDVACELARIAKQVYISTRRGAWIIRKTVDNGLPSDFLNSRFTGWFRSVLPSIYVWLGQRQCNKVMDHDVYGLRPKHSLIAQHPSLSDQLHGFVCSGAVIVKGNIREFTETGVIFEDGVKVPADDVVMATGYWFNFPHLDSGKLVPVEKNNCKLYKRMFPLNSADKNTLCVIGLIQPLGSIMPISEMQARVFFAVQSGKVKLPSPEDQRKEIEFAIDTMWKRYVKSPRHTIQVDYSCYMDELADVIDVKPRVWDYFFSDPSLFWRLSFGPAVAYSYRLRGLHAHPEARDMILGVEERRIRATRNRDTGFEPQNSNVAFWLFTAGLILFLYKLIF